MSLLKYSRENTTETWQQKTENCVQKSRNEVFIKHYRILKTNSGYLKTQISEGNAATGVKTNVTDGRYTGKTTLRLII